MNPFDYLYPEQQHALFLCLFPSAALLAMALVVRYCFNNWHIDAERSELVVQRAQSGILSMTGLGVLVFFLSHVSDLSGLFGILSLVSLRFDSTHCIAIGVALAGLTLRLRSHKDPMTLILLGSAGGLAALAFEFEIPWKAGLAWYLTFSLWVPLLALLRFRLIPPDPGLPPSDWVQRIFRRGAKLASIRAVADELFRQAAVSDEPLIQIGNQLVSRRTVRGHLMLPGASGTGKTILLRLMMQSVLRRIQPGSRERAIIFDAKHEQVSVIAGMGLSVPTIILNPFDSRTSAWDLAKDFKTPGDALQLAKLFLPDNQKDNDPFWGKTTRGLLADIIRAHILAMKEGALPHWTLSDVIRSLQSKDDIEAALALSPRTKDALRNIHEDKIYHGVLATLDLVRREFETLGALWDAPSEDPARRFSLNEWIHQSGILILGPSATAEEVINPLNRLILDRVAQLLLDLPDNDQSSSASKATTWLFLDEFPRLGRMPRIENLMTNGRSKGVIAVLAFQDISELKDSRLYGEHFANVIAGTSSLKVYFQASSHAHATWCTETIGSEEVEAHTKSFARTEGTSKSTTLTWSANEKTRPIFNKDEFLYLGKPGERTPLRLFPQWARHVPPMLIPDWFIRFFETSRFTPIRTIASIQGRTFRMDLPFMSTVEALLPKVGEDLIPRPDADQFLRTWKDSEPALLLAPSTSQGTGPLPNSTPATNLKEALFNIFRRKENPNPKI